MITNRTIKKIFVGITLPVFLFSLSIVLAPVSAADDSVRIIFNADSSAQSQLSAKYGLSQVQNLFASATDAKLAQTYTAVIDADDLAAMRLDPVVHYAQIDHAIGASKITTTDSFFTTDSQDEDKQWYLPKIKLLEAWEYGQGSFGTTVAIIDTGIHASHIELNDGRVVAGYNSITKETIPADSNSDDNGHGTAVAGLIGAVTNNNRGIAGINWNVSLMPVKALEADGTGLISSVAAAIVWAVDHDADVINLSLGGQGYGSDQALNDSIAYAYNNDVLVVAAAGNDLAEHGNNLDTSPVYPICADQGKNMVLGVAASDTNDQKAGFSNFGINCVDITAPGKKILTTAYLPSDPSDNVLIYGSGTSLAAPIVSGVAALLRSNNPSLTNKQVRDIIIRTADNIDALNTNNCLGSSCNGFLGKGRLNALSALSPQPLLDGAFVRETATGNVYQILGGTKHYVSNFVFQQRGFDASQVVSEYNNQLASLINGDPIAPLDGTLIKSNSNPTVYLMHQGFKRPLTFLVFNSRSYSFANVKTLPDADLAVLRLGEWYWPPDGTMVLVKGDPTVYVMDQEVKRPVTYFVFTQRKLSFAKVVNVTSDEFSHIPASADAYWMPPQEGTLVKSDSSATVFLINDKSKKPLSATAFINRKYSFSGIVTLPQAEINVILPGSPILN